MKKIKKYRKYIKYKYILIIFFSLINFFILDKINENYSKSYSKNKPNIIKLYWCRNNNIENGGDFFGKWLLQKMGYKVIFSSIPDIVICGSILKYKNIKNYTKIWGVGFHNYKDFIRVKNQSLFYAVRGKLTFNKLNLTSNIVLGDPGLLLSRFFLPKTKKEYDKCIVSHYQDYNYFVKEFGNKYYIINMGTNNIEKIANSINKCNFIFSSSLHGIIFSHSLGIPAVHLEYKELISKKNFKFKDYYSVLDIPYVKENLKRDNIDNIVKKYKNNSLQFLPNKKIIKKIQNDLLFSFPYKNKFLYL